MPKPASVDAYIAAAPKPAQAMMKQLRAVIKAAAPKAEEKISYSMPYYGYKGRLAYFAAAKAWVGLYVPPPVIADHAEDLQGYVTAMATVRFPLDKKLPVALVKKLIKARVAINDAKAAKGKATICSRGHRFEKSADRPVCPACWPGRYRKGGKAKG